MTLTTAKAWTASPTTRGRAAPLLAPRDKMEKIIGDTKRFTAYEFVELVEKKAGVKYSAPHARRLLRSLGFAVRKTRRIADRVLPKGSSKPGYRGGGVFSSTWGPKLCAAWYGAAEHGRQTPTPPLRASN